MKQKAKTKNKKAKKISLCWNHLFRHICKEMSNYVDYNTDFCLSNFQNEPA